VEINYNQLQTTMFLVLLKGSHKKSFGNGKCHSEVD